MEITETNWSGSLAELLDSLSNLEDNEPRKSSKTHKEWEKKLIDKMTDYNNKVGWKAFNTSI